MWVWDSYFTWEGPLAKGYFARHPGDNDSTLPHLLARHAQAGRCKLTLAQLNVCSTQCVHTLCYSTFVEPANAIVDARPYDTVNDQVAVTYWLLVCSSSAVGGRPCVTGVLTAVVSIVCFLDCSLCDYSAFKQFLELEPQVREVVQQFYNSKYAACLRTLDQMRVRTECVSSALCGVCARVCVCLCVCACVRACVHACVWNQSVHQMVLCAPLSVSGTSH